MRGRCKALLCGISFATVGLAMGTFASANSMSYAGNGASGFGSEIGNGTLVLSDDGTNLTVTVERGSGNFNDDAVLYIANGAGTFGDTSLFFDNGDGGRTAVSGANTGNPSQTVATFPAGFLADYAISTENTYMGLFGLAAGGNNSLNFITGASQSGSNTSPSYSVTFPLADIGITGGQTFQILGSLISTTAYRSNETFGASITVPGDGAGNAAFSNPQVFSSALSYTTTETPEPATLGALGVGALLALGRRRKA
jgi:hypothetical protein